MAYNEEAERGMFEVHTMTLPLADATTLHRNYRGNYSNQYVYSAWEGWKARAQYKPQTQILKLVKKA